MKAFDERRIDPTTDELLALLDRAMRRANAYLRERRLSRDRAGWRRFLRPLLSQPEGFKTVRGGRGGIPAALVEVAWWTDRLGRKHWRLVGRRAGWDYRYRTPNAASAHALCHVFPDRVVLRRRGDREELAAFCGCGAAGSIDSLAWAGECCGPCHDRREEGLPPLPGHALPTRLAGLDISATEFACTPDGQLVCVPSGEAVALSVDLATGTARALPPLREAVFPLAVSAAGLVAAITGDNRLKIADLNDNSPKWRTVKVAMNWIGDAAFSPDGTRLALAGERGVRLLDLPGENVVAVPLPARSEVTTVAFAGDRQTLLVEVDDMELYRIELGSGALEEIPPAPSRQWAAFTFTQLLAVSPDGKWLAVSMNDQDGRSTHVYNLPGGRWSELPPVVAGASISDALFTPQGELVIVDDGGALEWWDPAARKLLGALVMTAESWANYGVLTPDGTRLVGPDSKGSLRVWPWRQLLTD